MLFVRLFDLCLFGFVGFLFLLGSGKGCGLCLWHSLDFSLTFFFMNRKKYFYLAIQLSYGNFVPKFAPETETAHVLALRHCDATMIVSVCA